MTLALKAAAAALALPLLVGIAPATARSDACDALTVRLIRGTGASLAGRRDALVVFRSADAERMSLDCASPGRMLFRSAEREPARGYFALIGRAAGTLAGAQPATVEQLALRLHQASLLESLPREGRAGSVRLRCETGDRPDGFSSGTLCLLERASRAAPVRRGK